MVKDPKNAMVVVVDTKALVPGEKTRIPRSKVVNKAANKTISKLISKLPGKQDRQKDRQKDHHQNYQSFRQPTQQPIQQSAQQSAQQPAQQPVQHLNHESSHESGYEPSFGSSSQTLTDGNHAVVRTLVEEVDALRHAIEFVGQRNVETLAHFEALKKEFSSLMQKYTRLENSFKESVVSIPGGNQILQSMKATEERRRRTARNSVAIPVTAPGQSQNELIPEEKLLIDETIDYCFELLHHQVHVTNELREKLDLATQENAELRARLQSNS
ncbi:hypothetical protein GL218_00638 [Daldinia childiae]|uniref:uncharacterized protein n=1 Tax=Daldinia childiae TaxID=326645 RepID=UPI001446C661|nr:uncharacterized protein GL218_00638 [Daldinia childiae]KAF3071266.1 hypothetical protein GL218_00638 [Daldinia childiae]